MFVHALLSVWCGRHGRALPPQHHKYRVTDATAGKTLCNTGRLSRLSTAEGPYVFIKAFLAILFLHPFLILVFSFFGCGTRPHPCAKVEHWAWPRPHAKVEKWSRTSRTATTARHRTSSKAV